MCISTNAALLIILLSKYVVDKPLPRSEYVLKGTPIDEGFYLLVGRSDNLKYYK